MGHRLLAVGAAGRAPRHAVLACQWPRGTFVAINPKGLPKGLPKRRPIPTHPHTHVGSVNKRS